MLAGHNPLLRHERVLGYLEILEAAHLPRREVDCRRSAGIGARALADQVSPALTTVRVDKYGLGQECMQRMCAMLQAPGVLSPPAHVDVELIIRESA
jgi:hypothetical protein